MAVEEQRQQEVEIDVEEAAEEYLDYLYQSSGFYPSNRPEN